MLHITQAKHKKTREEIGKLPLSSDFSKRGKNFKPIPHSQWIDIVDQQFRQMGADVVNWKFATCDYYGKDSELHGSVDFLLKDDNPLPGRQAFRSLAWVVSNGGKRKPLFLLGGRFGIQGEGGFAGHSWELKKHSKLEVEKEVPRIFEALPGACSDLDNYVRRMESLSADLSVRAQVIVDLGRKGIIPWSRLSLIEEYCKRHFTYPETNPWWGHCQGNRFGEC